MRGELLMNCVEIAWAAGFWEGEGSCGVYANNYDYKMLKASVVQTDRAPIDHFVALFGGSVSESHRENCKTLWTWEIKGTKAYLFLQTIRPYVRSSYKRSQIERAITVWEVYRTSLGKTRYVTKRERRGGSTSYEVRVNKEGDGTVFVGTFRDPEAALLAARREMAGELYDFAK